MSHKVYSGVVDYWIDGDSVWVFASTTEVSTVKSEAFGVEHEVTTIVKTNERVNFRLVIVDAPERGQPGWREARAFCTQHLPPGTIITIYAHEHGDAGWNRTLADIPVPGMGSTTISSLLLESGHAKVWVPR